MMAMGERERSDSEVVGEILEEYARRGVFRAFSRGPDRGSRAAFRVLWHYDRYYDVLFDEVRGTLRIALLLPNVPQDSALYRELKAFLRSRSSDQLQEHRRIDPQRAVVRPYNRGGNVSLTLRSLGGDPEYVTRRLVQLVHEVFVSFLRDGPYYEYLIETFDLEPDEV